MKKIRVAVCALFLMTMLFCISSVGVAADTATLTLTKKVIYEGKPKKVNNTYYIGIFTDKKLSNPMMIKAISLNNVSEASVRLVVNISRVVNRSVTFYIAETDADGKPSVSGEAFGYNISVNGNSKNNSSVTLDDDHTAETVVIVNDVYTGKTQKGTSGKVKETKTGAIYKILDGKTAKYVAPPDKNITEASVPAKVTLNGKSYKVTAISANAFKGCKKLVSVVIGSNVATIEASAFSGCRGLETVTIGAKVKTIGKMAFYQCRKLTSVTIKSKVLTTVGTGALKGIASKAVIQVPKKKLSAYAALLKKKGIGKGVAFKGL